MQRELDPNGPGFLYYDKTDSESDGVMYQIDGETGISQVFRETIFTGKEKLKNANKKGNPKPPA